MGDLSLGLLPELGGSVSFFRAKRGNRWINLMRPLSGPIHDYRGPTDTAMFPMVPYANRIGDNRFTFKGRTYVVAPNLEGERLNLHGTGWQSKWMIARADATSVELVLDHIASANPYSYSAVERFVLTPERLDVTLKITNRGERAMPFGFGFHPWWIRDPSVTIRFCAQHFWLEGPGHLPTDRITLPPELDFSTARSLPQTWRNNCYSGWDGYAEILFHGSSVGLRIEADAAFQHLMLYCDPSKPTFCLEPQTHAAGALNRPGDDAQSLGLVILEPGETTMGTVGFTPFASYGD